MTFFWHVEEKDFHWHYHCYRVPEDVVEDEDWRVAPIRPRTRVPCVYCAAIDRKLARQSHSGV